MYIASYCFLIVITFLMGKKVYKNWLNPISVWASTWSAIGLLSNFAFFDFYKPSDYVNNVIIVGIIISTIVCSIYGLQKRAECCKEMHAQDIQFNIDFELFLVINIVAILVELPYFLRALQILLANGFDLGYLRSVYTDSTLGVISGGFMSILRDSGIKNVYTLSAIYAAILIVTKSQYRHKKTIVVIAVIEMVEYSITNAARLHLVNFIIFIVIALFFVNSSSISKLIKNNKKAFLAIALLAVFGLFLQNSRSGDMSILETLYTYTCAGPSYLTQLLSDTSQPVIVNQDFYHGTVTFGFISNIYYYLKIVISGINDSTAKLISSVITIKQYFVGSSTYINAMCTCFYSFLVDWGTAGSVVGPLVVSGFTTHFYCRMKQRQNLGSMAVCIYVFWVMLFSVFKWNLLNIDFSVVLLLNYFICPRKGQMFVVR